MVLNIFWQDGVNEWKLEYLFIKFSLQEEIKLYWIELVWMVWI